MSQWTSDSLITEVAYLIQRHFSPRPFPAGVSPGLGTSRSDRPEAALRSSSSAGLHLPLALWSDRPRWCNPRLPGPEAAPEDRRAACTAGAWRWPRNRRRCRLGAMPGPRTLRPSITGGVLMSPVCVLVKPPRCRCLLPKPPLQPLSECCESPCCTCQRSTQWNTLNTVSVERSHTQGQPCALGR